MRVKPLPPRRPIQGPRRPLWPLAVLPIAAAIGVSAVALRDTGASEASILAVEQNTGPAPEPARGEEDVADTASFADPDVFTCSAIRVHDGDGPIWCAEGPKIRLSGIAAREIDESCSDGHPCPAASGEAARDALTQLALGKVLNCRQVGTSYNRVVALCSSPDNVDLSCAMIRSGTALRWDKYDPEGRLRECEL